MKELSSYSRDFARLYDVFVYGRHEIEADEAELAFLNWAFSHICLRDVKEILDIGCGTGRVLIPLSRQGYTLTGLDNSPGMIEECARRLRKHDLSATLVLKDMEALEDEGSYDAVLCMNSGLDYLLTTERILEVLRRLWRALRPGGILILDSWNYFAQWERFGKIYTDVRSADGIRIDYQDRHWYDNSTSIYHIEMVGLVHEAERTYRVRTEHALRAMTVGERRMCLWDAGFGDVSMYPSFNSRCEETSSDGERMICTAIRPESRSLG